MIVFVSLLLAPLALAAPPGDPARGLAIASDRQTAACALCHPGPFPHEPIPADIGPDLRGVGARLTPDQLRRQLTTPAPGSIMPSYSATTGLTRVDPARAGRPILTDQQIEDVVAWLATLRTP